MPAYPALNDDADLFDFSQVHLSGVHAPRSQAWLREIPLVTAAAPAAPALLPRLLPWIGAQAAAAAIMAACVAQAMPQMPARLAVSGFDYALRLGDEIAVAPLPAGLDDGFRLRLSRTAE